MNCPYDEDYYERGIETNKSGYSNFRWIPELTIPLCFRIIEILDISDKETILDFGAAKGYLVKGFRLLHREAYGVDISPYAISQAPAEVRPHLFLIGEEEDIPTPEHFLYPKYNNVVAKDVLEHVPYHILPSVLKKIRKVMGGLLFVVVPLGKNGKFEVPAYENDITHIIREPLEWWVDMFKECHFHVYEATHEMKHIKENWKKWEKGNGFFILEGNYSNER